MAQSLFDAFRVESPNTDTRKIPLAKVVPMGTAATITPDPKFVFEYAPLRRALKNIGERKPIWCWGPSGCGKTEYFIQIAARLQRPCHVVSFGEETSMRELLGTFELSGEEEAPEEIRDSGVRGLIQAVGQLARRGFGVKTRFRYGHLVRAIQDPMAIVILDEFNMAPPGIAAQFNRLLETGELTIPETGETIRASDQVMFVVTANTPGSMDETGIYAGSQTQNGATRSRFAGLKMNYLPAAREEELINLAYPSLNAAIQLPDANRPVSQLMVDVANGCRTLVNEGQVSLPFTVRNLKEWSKSSLLLRDVKDAFADAYYDLLSPSEAVPVGEVFHKVFGTRMEG